MAFSRAWPDFTRGVMPTPIFVYANPAFCALTQYELVRNTCSAVAKAKQSVLAVALTRFMILFAPSPPARAAGVHD
jgi:hypothetical protein